MSFQLIKGCIEGLLTAITLCPESLLRSVWKGYEERLPFVPEVVSNFKCLPGDAALYPYTYSLYCSRQGELVGWGEGAFTIHAPGGGSIGLNGILENGERKGFTVQR